MNHININLEYIEFIDDDNDSTTAVESITQEPKSSSTGSGPVLIELEDTQIIIIARLNKGL